jgi:hypothetical protein
VRIMFDANAQMRKGGFDLFHMHVIAKGEGVETLKM